MQDQSISYFRASFAQQRLWFIDQLYPGAPVYNIPSAIYLTGQLNLYALQQALDVVMERHETLRTTFSQFGDGLKQVVSDTGQASIEYIDLQGLDHHAATLEIDRISLQEGRTTFDLKKGPLLRTVLLGLSSRQHLLLITIHHIISDAWSSGVLIKEITTLYAGFCEGRRVELPVLKIQYADYAEWQRERIQGERLETLLNYWKKSLAGFSWQLPLPVDFPRPEIPNYSGDISTFSLGKDLSASLRNLSLQEGCTLFTTLLSAFQSLMYRYNQEADNVIGIPVSKRDNAELEGLIGFFVNTVLLRTRFAHDATFSEILRQNQGNIAEALSHSELPFDKVVEALRPNEGRRNTAAPQVMFGFVTDPRTQLDLPGLSIQFPQAHNKTSKRDLTLLLDDDGETISGVFEYSLELFEHSTISRMQSHFIELLKSIVACSKTKISILSILKPEERQVILSQWVSEPLTQQSSCIHKLIEDQVSATPETPAIVFEDTILSYRELNCLANQLAGYLVSLGVGAETCVGIFMERSANMIVTLLAILKSGGAYVALDPAIPDERLAFIINDADIRTVVTECSICDRLPKTDARLVLLDGDSSPIVAFGEENLNIEVDVHSMAYLIYTSGSTGIPKGVVGGHRQLTHYLLGILECIKPRAGEHWCMMQSLAVDAPITQIFGALTTGGVLHIMSQERGYVAENLAEYMNRWSIDYQKIAPSLLQAMLHKTKIDHLIPQRLLLIGGESLNRELINTIFELKPECVCVNHYGPTEATCGAIVFKVTQDFNQSSGNLIPIGKPLANTSIYILDRHLQLSPIGVIGELYIAGQGLARGYFNRADLTAESFIPDPFSSELGARMYKTGDFARCKNDGNIEFHGRLDDQVKIRGFRVELREIEEILAQHVGVASVAVLLSAKDISTPQLSAFITSNVFDPPTADQLREYIRDKLPEYMVPSLYFILKQLPRTPQGKIDRRLLLSQSTPLSEVRRQHVDPQNPIEHQIAAIWREILHLDRISITDNFFDIGGHSLLLIQLHDRFQKLMHTQIQVIDLFQFTTVKSQASLLSDVAHEKYDAQAAAERGKKQLEANRRRRHKTVLTSDQESPAT